MYGYQPKKLPDGTRVAPPPKQRGSDPVRLILDEVYSERQRQTAKGYTTAHDDEHTGGEIAVYAACLALPADYRYAHVIESLTPPDWNTPVYSEYRRDLIKSVSMLVAEIERLDRAGKGARNA